LPDGEVDRVTGTFADYRAFVGHASPAELRADFAAFHARTLDAFAGLSDAELVAPSPVWWEEESYPIEYRLHRLDAHMRQHNVQAVKTIEALGQPQSEARQLIRLVYQGLAEVERAALGAEDVGAEQAAALAARVSARAD